MRFAILGPVEVTSDDRAVPLSPIRRRLLCALLVAGKPGLTADALVEALWGPDADPAAHERSLKTLISTTRRAVPGRIPLGSSRRYRLVLDPGDTLDVEEFRGLVAGGGPLLEAGRHGEGAAVLRQALRLWGSPGLPDLPDLPGQPSMLWQARDELLAERAAAQMSLLAVLTELGEHREVIRDVRRELESDPLSEPLHALLMRALAASGRRADALRHYDAAAETLRQETGSEPGAALRQLRANLAADDHPAAHPLVVPAQLPPDVVDWTGRAEEVAQVAGFLRTAATGVPIVTISGPGGVGKSALAVHAAHLLRDAYPDGQLYAELPGMAGSPDLGKVLGALIGALGVAPEALPRTPAERTALLRSLLAGRRVLLVIDNAVTSNEVRALLPGTAGCAVIVTSRKQLSGLPGACPVIVDPLPRDDSLCLLGRIVGRSRVDAEPDAARQIIDALDGLPLAVRIAGARLQRMRHWPLAHLAERLAERRLQVLTVGDLAISASIAESYEAMPEHLRVAFRHVSLTGVGDFPSWIAGVLMGGAGSEELLDALTEHSLLATAGVDDVGQPRYRLHDLLRLYGAERLAEHQGEHDDAVRRLLSGWLELVGRADTLILREPYHPPPAPIRRERPALAQAREAIDADPGRWLSAEVGNVLSAIRLACEEGRFRPATGLALRVASILHAQNRHREAEDMWRRIMHAAERPGVPGAAGDARIAAEARYRVAALITRQPGGARRASPLLDMCVGVWEEVTDRQALSRALSLRAYCAVAADRDHGDHGDGGVQLKAAWSGAEQAFDLAAGRHRYAEMLAARTLGLVAGADGRHGQAIRWCSAALKLAESLAGAAGETHRSYVVFALTGLVAALLGAGEYEEGLELARRGRAMARAVAYREGEASCVERAGDALARLGRREEAAAQYALAADLFDVVDRRKAHRCRRKRDAVRA
ncbi:BTAD domain-containing putative transcriptional regulator [Planotetraspora sp. GP83]|uniref:AfsR/SARP family transcriptional regulator n=1 Tax=Planotetraspora sp. GP83 TaxID=3156264 RepID=UPI003517ECF6